MNILAQLVKYGGRHMMNYSMTICSFYIHRKNSHRGADVFNLQESFKVSKIDGDSSEEIEIDFVTMDGLH